MALLSSLGYQAVTHEERDEKMVIKVRDKGGVNEYRIAIKKNE